MNEQTTRAILEVAKKLGAGGPDSYYVGLTGKNYSPGWARPEPSIWPAPRNNFEVAVWRYKDAKSALDLAGDYVPMELTERRNLLLVNPVKGNVYATTRNIVAAYQMIKPGEVADSHRHTPHALRLILDGEAPVYTVVNGKRIDMEPGDVVLTPGMHWHGHANESPASAYWIDFLDVPLVQHLESMFFEQSEGGFQRVERAEEASPFRFPSLSIVAESGLLDGGAGGRIPLDTPSMPSMRLSYVVLPGGASLGPIRETANNVYAVIQGSLTIRHDKGEVTAGRGDIVAMPLWKTHTLLAGEGCIALNVSDAPVHEKLGYAQPGFGA